MQQISGGGDNQTPMFSDPTGTFTAQTARAEMMKLAGPRKSLSRRSARPSSATRSQRYQSREVAARAFRALFMGEGLHGFMERRQHQSSRRSLGMAGTWFDPASDSPGVSPRLGDEAGSRGAGPGASRRCSTSPATRAGAAPKRPTAKTRSSSPAWASRPSTGPAGRQLPDRSPSRDGDRQAFRRARPARRRYQHRACATIRSASSAKISWCRSRPRCRKRTWAA